MRKFRRVWEVGIYEGGLIHLNLRGLLGLGRGIRCTECHFLVIKMNISGKTSQKLAFF